LEYLDPKYTANSYSENSANSCLNYTASHFRGLNPQAMVHVSCPSAYTKFLTYAAVSTPRLAMSIVYTFSDI